jgi:hypothetical protein
VDFDDPGFGVCGGDCLVDWDQDFVSEICVGRLLHIIPVIENYADGGAFEIPHDSSRGAGKL